MKKTLVIVAHPNIEQSTVNKRWVAELLKSPELFTVHELYKTYPNGQIDVLAEQERIEAHQHLIIQFPLYWFNCPPLLKQWLDDVLSYGWAYGSSGDRLKQKKIMLAVSAGIKEDEFSSTGSYQLSLEQILNPFKLTAQYTQADYQPIYAFYDAENQPEAQRVDQSALDYVIRLKKLIELDLG